MIPADLFVYDAAYTPAVQRAFGGFVIARSDAVAAKLMADFGIASVTLEGSLSLKGSVQVRIYLTLDMVFEPIYFNKKNT